MPSSKYEISANTDPAVAAITNLRNATKGWKNATIADFADVRKQAAQMQFRQQTDALRTIRGGSPNQGERERMQSLHDRLTLASRGGAGGGGKNAHAVGQVSMQLSDVAVQLQGGAKAATVIAQQGSQILGAFGPYGAILSGVVAIGAGLWTWVSNTAAADKAAQELFDAYKKTLDIIKETKKQMIENRQEADLMVIERLDGKEAADQIREQIKLTEELKELDEARIAGKMSVQEFNDRAEQIHRKFSEREKLRAKQKEDEQNKDRAGEKEELAAAEERITNLQREIDGETELAKAKRLREEAGKINPDGKGGLDFAKAKEKKLEKEAQANRIEKANTDAIGEERAKQDEARKEFRTEGEDAEMKHLRLLREQYKDIADKQKAEGLEREKITTRIAQRAVEIKRTENELDREILADKERDRQKAESAAQKVKSEREQMLANFGAKINAEVAREMMTPQERRAADKEKKNRDKAERRVIQRHVNELGTEPTGATGRSRRRFASPTEHAKALLRQQLIATAKEAKQPWQDDIKSCKGSLAALAQRIQVPGRK